MSSKTISTPCDIDTTVLFDTGIIPLLASFSQGLLKLDSIMDYNYHGVINGEGDLWIKMHDRQGLLYVIKEEILFGCACFIGYNNEVENIIHDVDLTRYDYFVLCDYALAGNIWRERHEISGGRIKRITRVTKKGTI